LLCNSLSLVVSEASVYYSAKSVLWIWCQFRVAAHAALSGAVGGMCVLDPVLRDCQEGRTRLERLFKLRLQAWKLASISLQLHATSPRPFILYPYYTLPGLLTLLLRSTLFALNLYEHLKHFIPTAPQSLIRPSSSPTVARSLCVFL
jgi:hypothetical protein